MTDKTIVTQVSSVFDVYNDKQPVSIFGVVLSILLTFVVIGLVSDSGSKLFAVEDLKHAVDPSTMHPAAMTENATATTATFDILIVITGFFAAVFAVVAILSNVLVQERRCTTTTTALPDININKSITAFEQGDSIVKLHNKNKEPVIDTTCCDTKIVNIFNRDKSNDAEGVDDKIKNAKAKCILGIAFFIMLILLIAGWFVFKASLLPPQTPQGR